MTDSVREKWVNAISIRQENNIKWQDLMSTVYVHHQQIENGSICIDQVSGKSSQSSQSD